MKKENMKIESACDNLLLDVTMFVPDGEIKGIFQISHGMAEHKERYYHFMEFLTNQGYVTVIHDHRGHGKSIYQTGDLGYFYDETATYIVEDVYQITKYMKEKYPNKKFILFGHSMGSMVVRKYIKKYDKEIDALIVCGSPSKNPLINLALMITDIVKLLKGEKYRSNFIQKLAFGGYNKKIDKAHSENAWVCANKESVERYDNDELCGFTFTTNGFKNLFLLMKDIYHTQGWNLENKDLPILFIAGADDPVIVNQKKWLQSQEFLKRRGYTNITGKLYPGFRHEILNEGNCQEVYDDILEFI